MRESFASCSAARRCDSRPAARSVTAPTFRREMPVFLAAVARGNTRRSLPILAALLAATSLGAQSPAPRRLSLVDAVLLAAGENSGVATAHDRARQADARIRQRRADLLPSVTAAAVQSGRTFNTATLGFAFKSPNGVPLFNPDGQVEGPVNTTDIRARLSQPLLDLGALARLRASEDAASAVATEGDLAAEQSATAAAHAYVRALRAQAQVGARLVDSSLAAELLDIAAQQLQAGVGILLDVTRARSQAALIRAQLLASRHDRDRALVELARATGLPADAPIELADSLEQLSMTVERRNGDLSAALARRPELHTLDAQRAAAVSTEQALRRERLPILSAFADHGPIAGASGSYLRTYTWGLQLSVSLFDGFRRDGRIDEQVALLHEFDTRRHDLARQVGLDAKAADDDLLAAQEQLTVARERVTLAEQELTQARDRFLAGAAGNADVVTALLTLNSARTLVIDALSAWHTARIGRAAALGEARAIR